MTVLVKKGPLPQFSHALEGHLRERLKFPVRLNEGTVELLQDVFLAKDGVRITPDQSRLLKLFGKIFILGIHQELAPYSGPLVQFIIDYLLADLVDQQSPCSCHFKIIVHFSLIIKAAQLPISMSSS